MQRKNSATIQSREDYDKDAKGQYQYWEIELKAALSTLEGWQKQGDRIVQRFLDVRANNASTATTDHAAGAGSRLNLFHANVTTLSSMLYGNIPKVDVKRRFQDPNDDVARVAGEMLERLLNNDIQMNGEDYDSVLRATLQDRLLPGMGIARLRYEVETEEQDTEFGPIESITYEDAPIEYYHWRDVIWGWARTWSDIPWIAFRSYMNEDEVRERFGEKASKNLQYKRQRVNENDDTQSDPDLDSPWEKAEIWEIWDKTQRQVCWVCLGHERVLDKKDDFLQLNGFYPTPSFFLANATTSHYMPLADFHLAQDLYNEIDVLQTRISTITQAVKVVGVYDKSAEGIQRMFKEGTENSLIPVDNWAMFGEKGGIQGQVDWVPIADIVNALDKLRQLRDENIGLLQQVTGMADVMRGELSGQYEGVGQTQMRAQFGSVRVQKLQDEFARFAGDLMQLKAEIICKHFEPKRIVELANMKYSPDQEYLEPALQLLKSPDMAHLRVEIKPESVAMVDFAAIKQERTEYINALSMFMQSAAPLMESDPNAKPFLLQLLQWGLAGFKGSSEIEGVVDKAIELSQQDTGKDKPDPEQQRLQAQQQIEQAKLQGELQKIQAKLQADLQVREADKVADIQTLMEEHKTELQRVQAELQSDLAQISAKLRADVEKEIAQSMANVEQSRLANDSEIRKEAIKTALEIQKLEHQQRLQKKDAD